MSDSVTDPSINRDEHDELGGIKGKRVKQYIWDPSTLTWIKSTNGVPFAVRLDSSSDPVLYVGKAALATATSTAGWQICKLDTTTGLIKTWADGDANFDNIWDNRASLSYS